MGNFTVAPRYTVTQQVPYCRASVAYNTANIGSTGMVPLGTLPAGAIVTHAIVKVTTAFNAATTNVLTVGTSADAAAVLTDADIDETVAGTTVTFAAAGYTVAVDTPLFVKYTQTGTAASAGAATIIIFFVPNNDR
jgi:hypothetical protein